MFVATGTTTPQTINNNGFFPAISTDEFVKTQKLDGIIADDRLLFALTLAISQTNMELVSWQIKQEGMGYFNLEDVPSEPINDISRLVTLYKQAVLVSPKLVYSEKYRDFDTTALGNKRLKM